VGHPAPQASCGPQFAKGGPAGRISMKRPSLNQAAAARFDLLSQWTNKAFKPVFLKPITGVESAAYFTSSPEPKSIK
jgi:hypothetical protein